MKKYFVLSNLDSYEPSIYRFDNLDQALEQYKEQLKFDSEVILLKKLEVKQIWEVEDENPNDDDKGGIS